MFDKKIKIFQSDGSGEFSSTTFINHLEKCRIIRQVLCPYTPKQNGVVERKHHHIVEIALTMMYHASLPMHLWVKAFLTTIYLINRMSLSTLGIKSPYQTIFKKLLDYNGLKVFSHMCYPYLRDCRKNKFDNKTYLCVFFGYNPLHKGYHCLQPKTRCIYNLRHVVFDKSISKQLQFIL